MVPNLETGLIPWPRNAAVQLTKQSRHETDLGDLTRSPRPSAPELTYEVALQGERLFLVEPCDLIQHAQPAEDWCRGHGFPRLAPLGAQPTGYGIYCLCILGVAHLCVCMCILY